MLERRHHVRLQPCLELLLLSRTPPPLRLHVQPEARDGIVDALAVLDLGALAICERVVRRAVVTDSVRILII
jgi:hypothetical protein